MIGAKLTLGMMRVILNIGAGHPASLGIHGQSAHGGLTGTIYGLYRRRLIDTQHELTVRGRLAFRELLKTYRE